MDFFNLFQRSLKTNNKTLSPSICLKTIGGDMERGLEEEYYKFLPEAFEVAGNSIQEYITKMGYEHPLFSWIQTRLQDPSFQHMCFRYGTHVYSILIALVGLDSNDDNFAIIRKQDYDNLIFESEKNNLLPCIIPININNWSTILDGIHMFHATNIEPISLEECSDEKLVPMSRWEINNMAIDIVVQYLCDKGYNVFSLCDVVGIEPQVWFYDKQGRRCFVYVNPITGNFPESVKYRLNINSIKRFTDKYKECVGYYAKMNIFPADPIAYDIKGEMVPLSKRENLNNPVEILFRGHGFYVNFTGILELHQAINEDDSIQTIDVDYYNVR